MQKPKLLLIDLDGTLVDSVPDLTVAVDALMRDLNMPERGEEKVRTWIGNGVDRLIKRALTQEMYGEPDQALFDKAAPIFYRHYAASNGNYSRLFPGVKEGIQLFAKSGIKLGCVTNKAESFTLPLLEKHKIREYFGVVVSGDTLPFKKPHPAPLLHAAKHFGFDAADCMMLGDSQHDVEAARAAGFRVVCVSYGYNHGEDIQLAKPDAVIDNFTELKPLFN